MIRFENVTKTYPRGRRPALDQVSIDVPAGELVFVVGPSGSGKSTLLRLVIREECADVGTVHVGGRDVARLPRWRVPTLRRTIGMVFQDVRLLPDRTAFANVAFSLEVIGTTRRSIAERVPEVLDLVGLEHTEQRFPHELSGGEQQRLGIARAIANRPQILLADEPTGNLDPATSGDIMRLLEHVNDEGTTVVMATHDRDLVDQSGRRVVELAEGRIVRDQSRGRYVADRPAGAFS